MGARGRLLLLATIGACLAACQNAAPAAAPQPKRHSFADSSADWHPAAPVAAAPAPVNAEQTAAQAQQIQRGWDQVHQGGTEQQQTQRANELLKQTQQMADQASPGASPH